jgi:4-diphosphocytidyl-2-C-methyl-D-erythritol kinase
MSERVITRLAPAKINLTLHVTGQRDDGYHLLDSLVCFADFGDTISVTRAKQSRLEIVGPMAQGVPTDARNLVAQAAHFIAPDTPLHIVLDKHLPAAAGIGGGSSDAATTLIAISELLDIPVPTGSEVLGADVPVCLHHSAVRMQGVGEVITQVPPLPDVHGVLINPGVSVATPTIF